MNPKPALFALLLFISPTLLVAQGPPDSLLSSLIDQYHTFQETENSREEHLFPAIHPDDQNRRARFYSEMLERLSAIPSSQFEGQQYINYEILSFILRDKLAAVEFENYLVPLNAEGGWYTDFILSAGRQRFRTAEDVERYIDKLGAFKSYAEMHIENMRLGLDKGLTAPYPILQGRENIVDDHLVTDPATSIFYAPLHDLPEQIPVDLQTKLRSEALVAISDSVIPAYRAFSEFWKKEYLPGASKAVGISAQPNGRRYYENRVRYYTTLPMTPEEVFETGKKEVARIRKEMEAIIEEVGFSGSFDEFLRFLRTDEQFYAKTPEQILAEAKVLCKNIDGELPRYFKVLPRNSYGVAPVPAAIAPTYTSGRYSPGSLSDGRAGHYWVNTYNLPARPLYALPALTLHEAVPGHHLQISLAQEMDDMPEFRRNTYISAFGEGWALYCEWLGEEMGIYRTPYERFGRLTYEMWRACRLVVDPGIHVMGWTRQKAIDFMASNTALSIHECTTEIDRYIGWPGQAVSYKIGELKIRELRKMAENKLGDTFDLREFHDLVLSNGSVPLYVLEKIVEEWVNDK